MLRGSDIEHAAHYMIRRYGTLANGRAEKRARDLAMDGIGEAAQIWRQIAEQIEASQNQPAGQPDAVAEQVRGRFRVINGGR